MNIDRCPKCGSQLTPGVARGLCPACLLAAGFASEPNPTASVGSGRNRFVPPTPEQLTNFFPGLEIRSLLGVGGMGAVYLASQRSLDRPVALKILPGEIAADPAFAERFAREARTLARLNHPHIVTVHESGQVGPWYFLQMEYVEGITLRQAIADGDLSPVETLEVVRQLCDALAYAHEMGVVHRDIKPENVLLDTRGRIKIADFGLAKLVGGARSDLTLTQSQQVMGTWHYMAPEQWERPNEVDHRADLYSLGVVFYELLTGHLPVGRFELPSEKNNVAPHLDSVVLKALERQPHKRYQHAQELKSDLECFPNPVTNPVTNSVTNSVQPASPFAAHPFAAHPLATQASTGYPFAESQPNSPHSPFTPSPQNELPNPFPLFSSGQQAFRRLPPLPFQLNDQGHDLGHGIARIAAEYLELEYRVNYYAFFVSFSGARPGLYSTGLPWARIFAFRLVKGWWNYRLIIQADSVQLTSGIPASRNGEVNLLIRRRDRDVADLFCAEAQRRINAIDPSTPTPPFHRSLEPERPIPQESQATNRSSDLIGLFLVMQSLILMGGAMTYALISDDFHEQRADVFALSAVYVFAMWMQGTLGLIGGWSRLTRASKSLAHIGSIAQFIPLSPMFPVGMAVGISDLMYRAEASSRLYDEARRRKSSFWNRLLGLPNVSKQPDDAVVDRRLRLSSTLTMLVGCFGVWLIATLTLLVMMRLTDDTEAPLIFVLSTPGAIAAIVVGALASRRLHWEICLIGVVMAVLPVGVPSILILPFAAALGAQLLSGTRHRFRYSIPENDADNDLQVSAEQKSPGGSYEPVPQKPLNQAHDRFVYQPPMPNVDPSQLRRTGIEVPPRVQPLQDPAGVEKGSPSFTIDSTETRVGRSSNETTRQNWVAWNLISVFDMLIGIGLVVVLLLTYQGYTPFRDSLGIDRWQATWNTFFHTDTGGQALETPAEAFRQTRLLGLVGVPMVLHLLIGSTLFLVNLLGIRSKSAWRWRRRIGFVPLHLGAPIAYFVELTRKKRADHV